MPKQAKSKHPWPTPSPPRKLDPPAELINVEDMDDDRSQNSSIRAIRGTRSTEANTDRRLQKTESKDSTQSEGTLKNPIWVSDDEGSTVDSGSVLSAPSKRTLQTRETASKKSSPGRSQRSPKSSLSRKDKKPKGSEGRPINLSQKSVTSHDTRSVTSGSSDASSIQQLSAMEDATLESELKQIALSGRSAMIGARAKNDVEAGSDSKHSRDFVEDDADKSWHGTLPNSASKETTEKRRFMIKAGLFGTVVLIGIVLGFYFGFSSGDKQKQEVVKSTGPELNSRQQAIQSIISGVTPDEILKDPETPQFAARQWLLFDDANEYDVSVDRVIQRYALGSFYFATGGQNAWADNNWLQGDECGANNFWYGLSCNFSGRVRAIVFGK